METKRQSNIISSLEAKGYYILAENARIVFADKQERRKSKISAINIAASLRDKLEVIAKNVLKKKVGEGVQDVAELLDTEFDRLEDKMAKILSDYLEYKSNMDNANERQFVEEQKVQNKFE